ncbi:hypothetical protein BD413DRAFT_444584, partial [Trametes elegans]
PPIVQFGRVAGHVLTLTFSYLSRATVLTSRYMHVPLSVLYTPITYLLGPVIVLSQVLLQIFVFSPYALLSSLIRNVYPIYVFVGAACICAATVGYVARLVSTGLVYAFF